MKKKSVFLFGCAVMVIAALFTLAGCPSPTNSDPTLDPTQFEGTWRAVSDGDTHLWTFTGTAFLRLFNGNNSDKGTFTFTATHIILDFTHEWSEGTWVPDSTDDASIPYTLSGNTLTMDGESLVFTKQ